MADPEKDNSQQIDKIPTQNSALAKRSEFLANRVRNLAVRSHETQVSDTQEVIFADKNLEEAIRESLGIFDAPLTRRDLKQVRHLDWNNGNLIKADNYSGLEYAINLENFAGHTPTAALQYEGGMAAFLRHFKKLQHLDIENLANYYYEKDRIGRRNLDDDDLLDISPHDVQAIIDYVRISPSLKTLIFGVFELSWVNFLAHLESLEHLDIRDNMIKDINPLVGLLNLEYLFASENSITDIRPLKNLTNLNELDLSSNQIEDLTPLMNLKKLRVLNLLRNPIADISQLASFVNLRVLSVTPLLPEAKTYDQYLSRYHQGLDISPLATLTQLQDLTLMGGGIIDINPLATFTQLHGLNLRDNLITDISPLADMQDLHNLNLRGNRITDISPLADMQDLHSLNLMGNRITDISPLADMQDLHSLNLRGNRITDFGLSLLPTLTRLRRLDLRDNLITDISPLSTLTQLHSLHLSRSYLDNESLNIHIPNLKASGVKVWISQK